MEAHKEVKGEVTSEGYHLMSIPELKAEQVRLLTPPRRKPAVTKTYYWWRVWS